MVAEAQVKAQNDKRRKTFGAVGAELPKKSSAPLKKAEAFYENNKMFEGVPADTIRKAWFTLSHLVVQSGAHIVDMGSGDGTMAYAMAALSPNLKVTGVEQDKRLHTKSAKKWELPNLEFIHGDISAPDIFPKDSLDAIINSFTLHEIYSSSRYHDRPVRMTLDAQIPMLKDGGLLFIRDYALPPTEEYVLMEMPDVPSKDDTIHGMSEPDLLIWYSEHARSRKEVGCYGFFLEELPPRFPKTRLFRLLYRWAYEFIVRKDDRDNFEEELTKEYAFFSPHEFRKALRQRDMRVLYTAPHWDETVIREKYDGHFRLYDGNGVPMDDPETSFIAVSQRMAEKESLLIHERRPARETKNYLRITAMRNEADGKLHDIVSRDSSCDEVLPYRITPQGDLHVFIREGVPRAITNSVPRLGKEIDGRRWSGHLTEAIAVDSHVLHSLNRDDLKETVLFARDWLGLKPSMDAKLEQGLCGYPAPDTIDEFIKSWYLRVEPREGKIDPKMLAEELRGFTTTGEVREVSAQSLLNAITVGLIPNARLELQIELLYERLGMDYQTWADCPLLLPEVEPENVTDLKTFMAQAAQPDSRFKAARGSAGTLRTINSVFVDEGRAESGMNSLASRSVEFVISEGNTPNVAVVIPLTKNAVSGEVMGSFITEYLPVPQRYQGNGMTMRAPSFPLPKEVTTLDTARRYIAEKFGVPVECVARMGESYFTHVGVTPQKVFPFAIAMPGKAMGQSGLGTVTSMVPLEYYRTMAMGMMFERVDMSLLMSINRAYKRFCKDSDLGYNLLLGSAMRRASEAPKVLDAETVAGLMSIPAAPAAKQEPEMTTNIVQLVANKPAPPVTNFSVPFHLKSAQKKEDNENTRRRDVIQLSRDVINLPEPKLVRE